MNNFNFGDFLDFRDSAGGYSIDPSLRHKGRYTLFPNSEYSLYSSAKFGDIALYVRLLLKGKNCSESREISGIRQRRASKIKKVMKELLGYDIRKKHIHTCNHCGREFYCVRIDNPIYCGFRKCKNIRKKLYCYRNRERVRLYKCKWSRENAERVRERRNAQSRERYIKNKEALGLKVSPYQPRIINGELTTR